jgi:hypothetical protein
MNSKYLKITALLSMFLAPALANANDIYITQVGDTLDLDIVQDGGSNEIGDSTTAVSLNGDLMTFSITQTGDGNDIAAVINGDSYTGTWQFTGDYNTVDLLCDSTGTAGAGNCEDVTLNITTTGDDNEYKFYIGEAGDAGGSTVNFTITGDDNVVDADIDGVDATVTVDVTNTLPTNTTSITSATDASLSTTNGGNIIDINVDGGTSGHSIDLDLDGAANVVTITQSGSGDGTVVLDATTNGSTIDITQSD